MNILFVEPFYSGSHKHFADQLKKYSNHRITLLTLEGKFWKWRMYGAAMTLAEHYLALDYTPDLIMVTDMLDLPTFLSGIRHKLPASVPVVNYFHENQLAYPWKADSEDRQHKRDLHYGMMNYHSAYASDKVLFNSAYNMDSFFMELSKLLKKMPDHSHTNMLETIKRKSMVMPLGLELSGLEPDDMPKKSDSVPVILWNHRWEHDKNPELFFRGLDALNEEKIPFKLILLGESYQKMPSCFRKAKNKYNDQLLHYGYASYDDYKKYLNMADLLPVTSIHEFFGISVMEAVYCGVTPLLPERLTYPELYHADSHPELFYSDDTQFIQLLIDRVKDPSRLTSYKHLVTKYNWSVMSDVYDKFISKTQAEHISML